MHGAAVRPRFEELGLSSDGIGDCETLAERLDAELIVVRSYAEVIKRSVCATTH